MLTRCGHQAFNNRKCNLWCKRINFHSYEVIYCDLQHIILLIYIKSICFIMIVSHHIYTKMFCLLFQNRQILMCKLLHKQLFIIFTIIKISTIIGKYIAAFLFKFKYICYRTYSKCRPARGKYNRSSSLYKFVYSGFSILGNLFFRICQCTVQIQCKNCFAYPYFLFFKYIHFPSL